MQPKEPRKLFEVVFGKKVYDVYDIEGKEHGGWNGEPKTWWIYYADSMPDGIMPSPDSENFEPWSKSIKRHVFDIRFKEYNTSKEKWNSTNFRSGIKCEMYCDNRLFYEFGTFDMAFAMAKAQYMITMMSEHSYDFFNPKANEGRKIAWFGMPATVKTKSDGWEIGIVPDYSVIPREEWWQQYRMRRKPAIESENSKEHDEMVWGEDDDMQSDYINWGSAFNDGYINWHP